jgi:cell division protein FtsW
MNFQPSEFAKLALILMFSHYLATNEGRLKDLFGVGLPGVSLMVPMIGLVMYQRDLGSIIILFGLMTVLLFVAGLDWQWLASLVGFGITLFGLMIYMEPFRMRRVFSFMDPLAEAEGSGYQVVQGWIALASGGTFGSGLTKGLAQQGFLPEAHTDFILAVIGEELGGMGWLVVVLLYGVLIWRGTTIAARATDLFGMLVATGITALLAAQVIINMGVVGGLLPPKGLVLPFVAYGASAAIIHTLCVAVLLRIAAHTWDINQSAAGGT